MATIIPLILSGGAGTRLWPASRDARPKQFLDLFGPRSTFQDTLERVSDPEVFGRPIIMTNRDHRFLVAEQAKAVGCDVDIILEPVRRDSGPAIAAGAHFARQRTGAEALVLVLAADHVIRDAAAFADACRQAAKAAQDGYIVTFGMKPAHPATNYGYIKVGGSLAGNGVCTLEAFVEKPDAQTAERYLAEGYLWNSGNFLFRADTLLKEYAEVDPETEHATGEAVLGATRDLNFIVLDESAFRRTKAQSVDYAVMEHTRRAAVLPSSFDWSDVGSWDAVWELSEKDAASNAVRGPVVTKDARNNIVISDKVLTAVVGVEDLTVVTTEDAVLVGRRDDAASLKAVVSDLRKHQPNVTAAGARVYRPWGSYQSLDMCDRYQVKRIMVLPGGQLSLQKHFHRAEHWVVVRGTAKVTVGETVRILHENESIYIPIGAVHRLENPGKIKLELIEVQTGSYLGEDDIVRLEDTYNRPAEELPVSAGV
jgi:mannose-1-phosphate guanylyltransferase/mannose-6-phosphate isomerase